MKFILISIIAILTLSGFINCTKDSDKDDDNPQITPTDGISFIKSNQTLGNTRSFGLSIADVDLDNDQDVFLANYIGPSKLWLNNGNGTFTQSNQVFNVSEVHDAGMADFNGDGHPDIFLLSHASPNKIYFNNGDGSFTDSGQNIGSATDYPGLLVMGDVDSDGDIDVFISYYILPTRLCLNDGNGIFTLTNTMYGENGNPGHMELADMNGDTSLDLFLCMTESPDQVLLNDGDGNFTDTGQALGSNLGNDAAESEDIDGDGDNDIVVANNEEGIIIWLNQNNTGTFVEAGDYFGDNVALPFKLFDADLDGDFDLITTHYESGNFLWENDGGGNFTSLGAMFGNQRVFTIGCEDLDGDNDLDVVFGQLEGTGGNSVYLNESTLGTGEIDNSEPTNYILHNNYPNPFKSGTTIEFTLAKPSDVMLKIYDADGRDIKTLINAHVSAGIHTTTWNGKDELNRKVAGGVYYYQLSCDTFSTTKQLILLED